MQPLLRALRTEDLEFKVRFRRELQLFGRNPQRQQLRGHGEKASLARFIAENEDFDLVVFMADTDSNRQRTWQDVVEQIQAGFDATPAAVAAIPCVPMSASESWLLADEAAWRAVGLGDVSLLPSRPENIWGPRDDPNNDHPHRFFSRVCGAAELPDSRDTRARVMQEADPAVLATRCPISFVSFQQDVLSL